MVLWNTRVVSLKSGGEHIEVFRDTFLEDDVGTVHDERRCFPSLGIYLTIARLAPLVVCSTAVARRGILSFDDDESMEGCMHDCSRASVSPLFQMLQRVGSCGVVSV